MQQSTEEVTIIIEAGKIVVGIKTEDVKRLETLRKGSSLGFTEHLIGCER